MAHCPHQPAVANQIPVTIVVECLAHIRDHVGWQISEREPGEFVALLRFGILDHAGPLARGEEEVDPLIVISRSRTPLQHTNDAEIVAFDRDRRFFASLTPYGGIDRLVAIEVASDDAVVAILVTGIGAAQQQNLPLADKQEMDRRDETETIRPGSMQVRPSAISPASHAKRALDPRRKEALMTNCAASGGTTNMEETKEAVCSTIRSKCLSKSWRSTRKFGLPMPTAKLWLMSNRRRSS